jgi:hypothetical protein
MFIKLYLIALPVFFALDMVWLGLVAKDFYRNQIGHLLKADINWIAAIVFYLLFIVGVSGTANLCLSACSASTLFPSIAALGQHRRQCSELRPQLSGSRSAVLQVRLSFSASCLSASFSSPPCALPLSTPPRLRRNRSASAAAGFASPCACVHIDGRRGVLRRVHPTDWRWQGHLLTA